MDFPLVYCNGDSYSDENYHPSLVGNTYSHFLGKHFNSYVINHAIQGSSNRRIIRSSVHDLIQQRSLNPDQEIIAVIGLSFELRGEVWIDGLTPRRPQESNFQTHLFTKESNWKEKLFLNTKVANSFKEQYNQGRAYYYSPYAERTNLFCDLVMFQSLMDQLCIKFLIFQGPPAEKLQEEYLLDFFKQNFRNENCFDFETFAFSSWCMQQNFTPLDFEDRPNIAHYGPDAHQAFANQILIPHFEKQ